MLSIIVSTIVYFIAAHYVKRWMEENDMPEGFTRTALVFCIALLIASAVGAIIDHFSPDNASPLSSLTSTSGQ